MIAIIRAIAALCFLLQTCLGHSFLTSPHPVSTIDGCRVGGSDGFFGNCPGPCPNSNLAADADPSNPTAIFQRGSYHRVVWSRNNHEGGFTRWTIVPVNKMYDKHWHSKMAFHFNCWNVGRFKCNEFDFHRDCNYDRDNEAFSKMLYIPPIYPDGDYVLGFTWYGGGIGYGHFGDYYDCAYIRIQGGENIQPFYVPEFVAGGGSMYEDGCEATVDKLGVCWREPCTPLRKTSKMVPAEFSTRSHPDPILSEWFSMAAKDDRRGIMLSGLLLVDAKSNRILDVDLKQIVSLNRHDEISIIAVTNGDVEYVEWYTNGNVKGRDSEFPFTISGDSEGDFYPWMHPLFNRRVRLAVKVVLRDGSFEWGNVELRFRETQGPGAQSYEGETWDEFLKRQIGGEESSDSHPETQSSAAQIEGKNSVTSNPGESSGAEVEPNNSDFSNSQEPTFLSVDEAPDPQVTSSTVPSSATQATNIHSGIPVPGFSSSTAFESDETDQIFLASQSTAPSESSSNTVVDSEKNKAFPDLSSTSR